MNSTFAMTNVVMGRWYSAGMKDNKSRKTTHLQEPAVVKLVPKVRGYRAISAALGANNRSIQSFIRTLDRNHVQYLSYSKIASVEFCPYRYYLEYVAGVRLRPEPSYFAKGRTFHKAADRAYRRIASGRSLDAADLEPLIRKHRDEDDHLHLRNAVHLLIDNVMAGWEVLGIEEPFVLSLGPKLPPCIGIVDLLLRKDDVIAVIDHKTGKNFGNTDELQMIIYRQHALTNYKAQKCLTFFDEYRWVNNLGRIRKPAFQRTEVQLERAAWHSAIQRFTEGYESIREIERTHYASGCGECYMCPYRNVCDKATTASFTWW